MPNFENLKIKLRNYKMDREITLNQSTGLTCYDIQKQVAFPVNAEFHTSNCKGEIYDERTFSIIQTLHLGQANLV
ncbi:unknown protein [Paenibacillus amylolyticus]|uniref:Uncharacterized protein n=1 Tax=Paenibacillus amylolyticus TaxID=1451 RepID=A0A100VKH2_PAEAM|nr:unknown protein [Paenibacillus amylolyticus]